jgi:hypothetical protein
VDCLEVEPMELTPKFNETFEHSDWGAFEFVRTVDGCFRLQPGCECLLAFERR